MADFPDNYGRMLQSCFAFVLNDKVSDLHKMTRILYGNYLEWYEFGLVDKLQFLLQASSVSKQESYILKTSDVRFCISYVYF